MGSCWAARNSGTNFLWPTILPIISHVYNSIREHFEHDICMNI
jgi:hypothetical protein